MMVLALALAWLVLGLATHYAVMRLPDERNRPSAEDDALALFSACALLWPLVWGWATLWVVARVALWYIARTRPCAPDAVQLEAEREVDTLLNAGLSPQNGKD